ncbi:secernin-1-like [Acipenser ruthenus]|uniref:secernin-1-like n=1 Tax=Acipenser ruthenus TaxID=7906 RepID=UPI00145AB19E|nr:secernin-1-like [Acipenser ruthenus]XP_033914457.1 secernin-1-like [Acipenser ruthenus]XP_033914458.1 secernin-1-like [Acipenser ruthenus]
MPRDSVPAATSSCRDRRARLSRMAVALPSSSFVAFPPVAEAGRVVFGKNSTRPRDEVQEVVYFPCAEYEPGAQVECTYITINQVERTHAVVLSRPAWLWGAEMGANEHGVCIANAAVVTKEPGVRTEALLGMDLVRLGVERGSTAKVALDTIVSLLEEHGQGGNYSEDRKAYQAFHSAFLIADRVEGWVLETVGKYWAAERITEGFKGLCQHLSITTNIDAEHSELRSYAQEQGWWSEGREFNFSEVFSLPDEERSPCAGKEFLGNQEGDLTVQTVIDALRDKETGVCVDSESLLTTASMVSVLPQSTASPCVHFFTATPDPARSIFKPFIFVDDVKLVPQAQSPCFGEVDPVKIQPRFESKVDRRHELYKAHEWALTVIDSEEEPGQKLKETMLDLEKQGLQAMEDMLLSTEPLDPAEVADLFYDCVDTEIKFYKRGVPF